MQECVHGRLTCRPGPRSPAAWGWGWPRRGRSARTLRGSEVDRWAGVLLGGAAALKERYGLISRPDWGVLGISARLVRSALACAIPITAAPPMGL